MKAEELQLGDIVATTPSGMPIKVAAIHRKKVAYHACTDRFSWVRIGLLRPIPLTPEILEKNGLEKIYTDYYDLDVYEANDGLWRVVYSNLECSGFDESVLVSSVHELQHFLRHLKIEKEIEI